MKTLVTGGAGFIGSHAVVELAQAGHTPVILDNFCNSQESVLDGIEKILGYRPKTYVGDCADPSFLESVFSRESVDGIIHFTALKSVGESLEKPLLYYRNNIDSLLAILDAALRHNIKALVFSSSAVVYGEPDMLPIPETAPRKQATSPYGNTKQICEDILRDVTQSVHGSLRSLSLRYFNPVGAHTSGLIGELPLGVPNNLVPYLTQTAAGQRERLTIFGGDYPTPDGTCIRDYIHVVDLARAHIAALDHLLSAGDNQPLYDIYNVGTGHGTSVKELVDTFERVTGVLVPQSIGSRRPGDIASCYADPDKIRKELGWRAELTLSQALKDAWKWQ
ncbi:MAG: UDP-glucose 4-epimerase GalE [Patescibacteria group bacterium]